MSANLIRLSSAKIEILTIHMPVTIPLLVLNQLSSDQMSGTYTFLILESVLRHTETRSPVMLLPFEEYCQNTINAECK